MIRNMDKVKYENYEMIDDMVEGLVGCLNTIKFVGNGSGKGDVLRVMTAPPPSFFFRGNPNFIKRKRNVLHVWTYTTYLSI